MGFGIGSAISSAVGGASSIFGGAFSQKQQYKYNKAERLKGPGWDVKGLRDAGLNPILAAQKSGPTQGVGGFSVSPVDIAGQMDKISSSSAKDADAKIKKAQSESARSQANIDRQREFWQTEMYNFMQKNKGLLLPISASSAAGFTPRDAKDAAATSFLLNVSDHGNNKVDIVPTSAKGASEVRKKSHKMNKHSRLAW